MAGHGVVNPPKPCASGHVDKPPPIFQIHSNPKGRQMERIHLSLPLPKSNWRQSKCRVLNMMSVIRCGAMGPDADMWYVNMVVIRKVERLMSCCIMFTNSNVFLLLKGALDLEHHACTYSTRHSTSISHLDHAHGVTMLFLTLQKNKWKHTHSSTFSLFSPTRPAAICNTHAIWYLIPSWIPSCSVVHAPCSIGPSLPHHTIV